MSTDIAPDTLHPIPKRLEAILRTDEELLLLWDGLTPLARNEWICYITIPKKEETKITRLGRLVEDIREGKKRPCCRPGCPHRRESAKKWFK